MRLFWIALLGALLISCKAPLKVAESQEVKVVDKTQVNTSEKQESKLEVETSTSTTVDEFESVVTTTKIREYDSNKPIDSTTGKPPLKSYTETTQTKVKGKKAQENTTTAASDTTSIQKEDNIKKDVKVEVEQEHSEKKQIPDIVWWAASIIGVGILILIFWGKISGWFKGLFR